MNDRFRLAADIDFSRAKNHGRCHGTGIVGYKEASLPGEGTVRVPIICRCVVRNGGVKKDDFDKLAEKVQQQVVDGSFSRSLADDVMGLPGDVRDRKIVELTERASTVDEKTSSLIREALRMIGEANVRAGKAV